MTTIGPPPELVLRPIGFVRSPFLDRASAPRQPYASKGAQGTIELVPHQNFEHALDDLAAFDRIWVIFWFHLNEGWRPKVLPPRSTKRRGLFATRSPHRPNPLGLSVLELESVEGLTLKVRNIDLIDGTPVLDIKPYIPFADAIPAAKAGWLEPRDPEVAYSIAWSPCAEEQLTWLREIGQVDLATAIVRVLSLGPQPHPYRRIKLDPSGGLRLAVKDWRVRFRVDGRTVTVEAITTGYRAAQLAPSAGFSSHDDALEIHRAFVARFGDR